MLVVLSVTAGAVAAAALIALAHIAVTAWINDNRRARRQLIRREQLRAEFELQRALQNSVTQMFDAARQGHR